MCLQLIAQFKTCTSLLGIDVKQFMREYGMNCPAATKRLLEIGVPATVEHSVNDITTSAKNVAETVQVYLD
jgi:ESCRT-I complex subunit VPS28